MWLTNLQYSKYSRKIIQKIHEKKENLWVNRSSVIFSKAPMWWKEKTKKSRFHLNTNENKTLLFLFISEVNNLHDNFLKFIKRMINRIHDECYYIFLCRISFEFQYLKHFNSTYAIFQLMLLFTVHLSIRPFALCSNFIQISKNLEYIYINNMHVIKFTYL